MNEFIVAEVSKNWIDGLPSSPGVLANEFECVIEVNRKRGYALHSWQLGRVHHRAPSGVGIINETIIAVFRSALPIIVVTSPPPSQRKKRKGA